MEQNYIDENEIVNIEFFNPIKHLVVCAICKGILRYPKQCNSSENCFCAECIAKWTENSCPYKCTYFQIDIKVPRAIKNLLYELKFKGGESYEQRRGNMTNENLIKICHLEGYDPYKHSDEDYFKKYFLHGNSLKKIHFNGDIYEGQMVNCLKEGYGIYKHKGGYTYVGQWKSDLLHGKGKECFSNGDCYTGEFANNKRNGYGIFMYSNGDISEGDWLNNIQQKGIGKQTINGETFTGIWTKNELGKSVFISDNPIFEMNLKNQRINGQAKAITFDGNIYDGNWVNGKKEGYGVKLYIGGDKYEGNWSQNQRNGKGKFTRYKLDIYDGDWKNDNIHGYGLKKFNNKNEYEGEFADNELNGKGKMIYIDGSIYEGNWKNSIREGKGMLKDCYGNFKKGNWQNDKYLGDK